MTVSVPGLRYCEAERVSAEDVFPFQFMLGSKPLPARFGFRRLKTGSMVLSHSSRLRVARLRTADGHGESWCLGVAVDPAGQCAADGGIAWRSGTAAEFWEGFESYAAGLAGRYLLIARYRDEMRIYGDPSGSFACVYDPQTGTAGSSLLLALERDVDPSRQEDVRAALNGKGRIPFGRTADAHARLLSSNHYLKLPEMTEHRFWPRPGEISGLAAADAPAALEQIQRRLGTIIGGLAQSLRAVLPLSGGNDSRTLLACAKPHLPDIARFYTQTHNFNSRADRHSAARLCEVLGLEHETFEETVPFTAGEAARRRARFEIATGHAVQPTQTFSKNFWDPLGAEDVVLQGNILEILRASNWRTGDRGHSKLTRDFCLKRCKYIGSEGFTDDYIRRWRPELDAWLDGLPPDAQEVSFDFAYIEHLLTYHGTSLLGLPRGFAVFPFNDRRLLALAARLPLGYRHSNAANRDLLEMTAPELAQVPYARDIQAAKRERVQARRRNREDSEPRSIS